MDVMDPVATVRSFDNGKIGKDGRPRNLHIADYFRYIDRSIKGNNPNSYLLKPKRILNSDKVIIENLLETKHYSLDKIVALSDYSGRYTSVSDSYHHLFVKSGKATIFVGNKAIIVSQGHSCFRR